MNNLKQNPTGIDIDIQKLQTKLYNNLNGNIEGYGRVYRYEKENKTIPAHFLQGNDYKEVLTTDKKDALFFFLDDSDTNSGMTTSKTKVDLVFIVNLVKQFPTIAHRADEEFKQKIYRILKRSRFFFESEIQITKGIEALKEFEIKTDNQPYYIIKFSGEIKYQLD